MAALRPRRLRLDQHAGSAFEHRLERPASDGDHRASGGLRLDRDDAELLYIRKEERPRTGIEPGKLAVLDPSEELSRPVRSAEPRLEPGTVWPRPDDPHANPTLRAASSASSTRL